MKHIAVIGAGITGITTTYALLERGYQVTVFDRNRYPAMLTSYANGGQLSASNAEVWTTMSTVLKGISWMLKKDAPLLVNPRPCWHKYSWMAEFVSNIPRYESNTVDTVRLAMAAREHLFRWAEIEGIDFDHESRGILHVYKDEKGYRHAEKVNELLARGGLHRDAVGLEQMREIEPSLSGDFVGGFFTPSDSTGDIHKYTRGLAAACERQGCEFHYDSNVEKIEHKSEQHKHSVAIDFCEQGSANSEVKVFDGVVVCAGAASRKLAAQLGDRVNIYPVKGYSITVELNDQQSQQSAPWVSLLDDDAKIVTSRLGEDRFRIAGTAEFNGFNYDIRQDRIDPLVSWCRQLFPGVDTSRVIPWAGLRPMMPNMMPRVGAGKQPGVFYNTGHGHLGWTLSAATAELVATQIAADLPHASKQGATGIAQAAGQSNQALDVAI